MKVNYAFFCLLVDICVLTLSDINYVNLDIQCPAHDKGVH